MPLSWSAKELKSLPPVRGATSSKPPTRRQLDKQRRSLDAKRLRVLLAGVNEASEPELLELRQNAVELLAGLTPEAIGAASLETLGGAEVMFARAGRGATLTELLVDARGLEDAVRTKIRSLQYRLDAARAGWMTAIYLTATAPPNRGRALNIESWLPLRRAIARADDPTYARARNVADAARIALPLEQQAFLAYTFADESWGEELLDSPAASQTSHASRAGSSTVSKFGFLLSTCRNPDVALKIASAQGGPFAVSQNALILAQLLAPAEALKVFQVALPPLMVRQKRRTFYKTPPRNVLLAITKLDAPGVAETIAPYVGDSVLGPLAALYFQGCPDEHSALENTTHGKAAQTLSDTLTASQTSPLRSAPPDVIPAVLRDRAWRPQGKRTPIKRIKNVPLISSRTEYIVAAKRNPQTLPLVTGEQLDTWRKDIAQGRGALNLVWDRDSRVQLRTPPAEALEAWNAGKGWLTGDPLDFVTEHGLDALPGFLRFSLQHFDYEGATGWLAALKAFETPRIAVRWASLLNRRKKFRPAAEKWLAAHPEMAAEGLIAELFGANAKLRKDAESALVFLSSIGHRQAIRTAAALHEPNVQAAVTVLLDRDVRVLDQKPPKWPEFLRPDLLPPLRLRDSEWALAPDDRDALLELLSIAPIYYAPLADLREAFDSTSLAAFCDAVLDQWARQHGPGRFSWMLQVSVALGSSTASSSIGSIARAWARNKGAAAARACEALSQIADEEALQHLAHIAATTRFSALRKQTDNALNDIAASRGLSRDALEDRCVPDLGLDKKGVLDLSFGDTRLSATFEGLNIVLMGNDQQKLRSFPRVSKAHKGAKNPEREASKARYDHLKKNTRAVLDRTNRRLERAMVDGRSWTTMEATRFFFEHPLLQHLARGLVWQVQDQAALRLTGDGTFADVEDEEVQLKPDGRVSIAHVLELKYAEKWRALFEDYALLQPFSQLGREGPALRPEETKTLALARYEQVEVRGFKLLGALESRGWRRNDAGSISRFDRNAPRSPGFQIRLSFAPSIDMAYRDTEAVVRTTGVAVFRDGTPQPFLSLDAISALEAFRDLDAVLGVR